MVEGLAGFTYVLRGKAVSGICGFRIQGFVVYGVVDLVYQAG